MSTKRVSLSTLYLQDLMRQLDREQTAYNRLMDSGRQLRRQSGPEADREGGVGHTMQQLQNQWEATRKKADDRKVSGRFIWFHQKGKTKPIVLIIIIGLTCQQDPCFECLFVNYILG